MHGLIIVLIIDIGTDPYNTTSSSDTVGILLEENEANANQKAESLSAHYFGNMSNNQSPLKVTLQRHRNV